MSTFCSSLLLTGALLLAAPVVRAQSADIPHYGSLTGLQDPEPADPRYADLSQFKSAERAEPVEQLREFQRPVQPADTPTQPLSGSRVQVRKP